MLQEKQGMFAQSYFEFIKEDGKSWAAPLRDPAWGHITCSSHQKLMITACLASPRRSPLAACKQAADQKQLEGIIWEIIVNNEWMEQTASRLQITHPQKRAEAAE